MLSGLPAPDDERRIIPFPRVPSPDLSAMGGEELSGGAPSFFRVGRGDGRLAQEPENARALGGVSLLRREEAARHYLKFMLPAIPITMFVLGFVYCALLMGAREGGTASPNAARLEQADSALPLVGALLLAGTAAGLCVMIYLGYLRASGQER